MDEPSDDWEIQEGSTSACCSSKASWFFDKGLWLGKRAVITGCLISSAPLVLPPLVVASALGIAVSIPSGVVIASYACTEKLMSTLLPMPTPSLTFDGGTVYEEETEELEFGGDLSVEENTEEHIKDVKTWSETKKELLEGRDDEILPEFTQELVEEDLEEDLSASRDDYGSELTHTAYNDEEPVNDVDAKVKEEWYVEDVGEDLNAPRGDYGNGHRHTEYNDEAPMDDVDGNVKEGDEEDVGEDMNTSKNDYGTGHTHAEHNDEEPMNDEDAKVKEEGYEGDRGEYLEGEDEGPLESLDVEIEDAGDEENEGTAPVTERIRSSLPADHVHQIVDERNEENDTNDTEENVLAGEIMALIDNIGQDADVSTPMEEAKWDKKYLLEFADEKGEKNFASLEENGKRMDDEEEPITWRNEEEETNDIDANVEEQEYKEKLEEYLGEDERPLQGFHVEIDVVGEDEKRGTAVVIERSEWDQPLDDADQIDAVIGRNDKGDVNYIEDENLAGKTTELIEELRQEGSVSIPVVKADSEKEEEHEVSKERDEKNSANIEEITGPVEDSCVEPVKLIPVNERTESELIQEETKENKGTQTTGEDPSDDVMAGAEGVVATSRILQVNKDESNINNGLMVSEKPTTGPNGSYDGEGRREVEEVAEKERTLATKKTGKRKRRNKNRTSGAAAKGSQSETNNEEVVLSDAGAREVADESGLNLFNHIEKADETYPPSAFENPKDYEKLPLDAPEIGAPLEICLPAVVSESNQTGTGSEFLSAISTNKALLCEEKIWENIEALRMIVGYNVAPQETCVDELKSLYIFTGVEPPTSFKSPADLVEVNDKLHFLMAIVGVK